MNLPPLILITGPPRSGTTLLNRVLCESPELGDFLPECTFLTKEIQQYNDILLYAEKERFVAYFGSEDSLRGCFKQIVEIHLQTLISNLALDAGVPLVLKDPMLSLCLDQALALMPDDTRYIITLRDPRDVLASMKTVRSKQKQAWNCKKEATDMFSFYYKIQHASDQKSDAMCFIKYEDMVMSEYKGLGEFVKMPHKERNSNNGHGDLTIDKNDPFYSPLYNKPVDKSRVGAYKKVLSWRETRFITKMYAGVLDYWGYDVQG